MNKPNAGERTRKYHVDKEEFYERLEGKTGKIIVIEWEKGITMTSPTLATLEEVAESFKHLGEFKVWFAGDEEAGIEIG